ncbi:MAG TPA: TonB-dependent receptor [Steroidobacter sp.]|uniref:TonB-dependent receptor n=1 Tax=Steroidobacter sp. TaxID=1978227 RepID=UPI002ED88A26
MRTTYNMLACRVLALFSVAAYAQLLSGVALAAAEATRQTTPARAHQRPGIAEEDGSKPVEEVIVTAQKRSERLIDTPLSVTALSSDNLAKIGATQFRDFADTVPGLSFQTSGPGYTQISMRGVTVGQDAGATVGIYVDEVPYGSSTSYARGGQVTLDVGLFDLDRVEVLRGPQGTLYGASSMGGVIKYVTRQPDTSRFGMDVQTGVSSTHDGGVGYNGAVAVNAPLAADKAALRVSSFYSHEAGYVDNILRNEEDVNKSNVYGGRADLLLMPTDAVNIRISGFAQDIDRDGAPFADYRLNGEPVDGSLTQRRVFEEPFDQSFRLLSGTVTYDAGPVTVTSVSSYQTSETDFWLDNTISFASAARASGAPTAVATGIDDHSSTDKFTQEVRVASASSTSFEWLIGGFYTNEESEFTQDLMMLNAAGQPLPNNVFTFSTPTIYEESAVFGDITWYLTSKLDVTAGVRYAKNRNRFEQIGTGTLGRTSPRFYASDEVFTYLGNVRYRVSDHATAYIRYATGYRPGGPNVVSVATDRPTFEPDTLKNYEIGFKMESEDRRFAAEVAAYYIDWNNIIVTFTQSGFAAKTNVPGGADIRGGELTLSARPFDGLSITTGVGYQDAQLSEANIRLRAAKGERLPTVPRYNANLNIDWELPWTSLQPLVGATARFVDDRTSSYNASTSIPQYELPSYTTIDLRAGVTLGSVFTQFYVRNLFDERAQLMPRLTSPLAGPMLLSISQPRTMGLTASVKF